jgi:hypothetical protein
MTFVIGFDVSVTSPSVCVGQIDGEKTCWNFACFAQRNRDFLAKLPGTCTVATLTVLPRIPGSNNNDLKRYQHIVEHFLEFLKRFPITSANTCCAVEGYAFVPASQAGSSYKLHELTAVLKMAILRDYDVLTQTISIGTWKRYSCGKGNVNKLQVLEGVESKLGLNMLQAFDLTLNQNGDVPCPVQDVCDSFGVAYGQQQKTLAEEANLGDQPKRRKLS